MKNCWIMLVLLVVVSGCQGGGAGGAGYKKLKLAPAKGVIKLKGKPLEKVVVTFLPEKGVSGIAIANDAGEFTVKTNGQNGAPVGRCKVTVTSSSSGSAIPPSDGNEMQLLNTPKINQKYTSPDSTDLFVEIPEKGDENLVLELDE